MKKVFGYITGFSILSLISPVVAFAQTTGNKVINCNESDNQFSPLCNLGANKIGSTIGQVITFAFIAAVLIALLFLIYGGIKWITAGGDKSGVEEARNHVVGAIVGLIIVFLSYFIINLILFLFTGSSLSELKLPTLKP